MRGFVAIGDEIRRLRRTHGMTQKHLAMRSSCSVRTVRNAGLGRAIDLNTVTRIAAALEVRVPTIAATESDSIDNLQRQEQIVPGWCAALLDSDLERIVSLYDEQAIIARPGANEKSGGDSHRGIDQIRTYFQWELANFRTLRFDEQKLDAVNDLVFHRSQTSMHSIACFRTLSLYRVHELEIRDDKIVRQTTVTDFSKMHCETHDRVCYDLDNDAASP